MPDLQQGHLRNRVISCDAAENNEPLYL